MALGEKKQNKKTPTIHSHTHMDTLPELLIFTCTMYITNLALVIKLKR